MWIKNLNFNFFLAFLIRILFTFYGFYHDDRASKAKLKQIPKYTDIDYQVFTDAAWYISKVRINLKKKPT